MQQDLLMQIISATGAQKAEPVEVIQTLWSGYGEIVRIRLHGAAMPSVVLKHIQSAHMQPHPRGWQSNRGHERKVKSYQVEMAWYRHWSELCPQACRVPRVYAVGEVAGEQFLLLEDLDAAGFPRRYVHLDIQSAKLVLRWLAHFHARFMGVNADDLWQEGSYWHLATRPDEYAVMQDMRLKQSAAAIDTALKQTSFQTLIHGDAKVANFCFAESGDAVAAVDFQYVGGGCGMKDVAYFLGSCLTDAECLHGHDELLNEYFSTLNAAMLSYHPNMNIETLEQEWRDLYPMAWADFYRFLNGWMPTHTKFNDYGAALTEQALQSAGTC